MNNFNTTSYAILAIYQHNIYHLKGCICSLVLLLKSYFISKEIFKKYKKPSKKLQKKKQKAERENMYNKMIFIAIPVYIIHRLPGHCLNHKKLQRNYIRNHKKGRKNTYFYFLLFLSLIFTSIPHLSLIS